MSKTKGRKPTPRIQRVRAADVAKLAGVSRSAVSRAFSPNAYISADTKAKVMEASEMLDYRPDYLASSLASGSSNIVVIAMNQLETMRGQSLHVALPLALQKSGRIPVVLAFDPADDGRKALREQITFPIEGLVVMADSISLQSAEEAATYVRPIMLNSERGKEGALTAHTDEAKGISEMVEYLAATGHRSVAFVSGRPSSISSIERKSALQREIDRRGMRLIGEIIANYDYDTAFSVSRDLFDRAHPDAVFCANDFMALGVLDYLRLHTDMKVPDDISIVGFDDFPVSSWPGYDLSSIASDMQELAASVVGILDQLKSGDEHIDLPESVASKFIMRGSVGPRR